MSERPSENPPASLTVLDYASYNANGIPPVVVEAERLIERQCKPKAIRKYFLTTDQAIQYFVKSMRRRFPIERPRDKCELCGSTVVHLAAAGWRAKMPQGFSDGWYRFGPRSVSFNTFHGLCDTCHANWDRRVRIN